MFMENSKKENGMNMNISGELDSLCSEIILDFEGSFSIYFKNIETGEIKKCENIEKVILSRDVLHLMYITLSENFINLNSWRIVAIFTYSGVPAVIADGHFLFYPVVFYLATDFYDYFYMYEGIRKDDDGNADISEREPERDSALAVKPQRKMPDRILGDWSNLRKVVRQFRNLGYGDTYILETILDISDVKNGKDLFVEAANGEMIPSKLE